MDNKVWLITGASRGLGRVWAEAALSRGDKVAATARKWADVADLQERFGKNVLPLSLDVTEAEQVRQVVQQAHQHFGKLDVILNNAGYALAGSVEEVDEGEVRAQFDTNFFGVLRVIQAALPLLRQQGSGHLVTVSSSVAIKEGEPLLGFYGATKWAIEGLHESLAKEIQAFGINVTLIEPGAYGTDFYSSAKEVPGMEAYANLRSLVLESLANMAYGNPQSTAEAILRIVDAKEPPLRLVIGSEVLPMARSTYADRLATWEAWEEVSNRA